MLKDIPRPPNSAAGTIERGVSMCESDQTCSVVRQNLVVSSLLWASDLWGKNMPTRILYVAMAASALMVSSVVVARAALDFCDIYPERCQYSPSGKGYYYPQGYRLPSETGTAPTRRVQATNRWGCSVTDGTQGSVSYGYPSRAAAADGALTRCRQKGMGGSCRIVSCSASIRTRDEARAIWLSNRHR
jgi:hypothetical protein